MLSVTADGKYVCGSIAEDLSHILDLDTGRGYIGFQEMHEAMPKSIIYKVAVDGSSCKILREENYWIGHVNTSPTRANLLTFCHEGPWEMVDHRIWCIDMDTEKVIKIRPRSVEGERIGHEYWYADGITIGYHGSRPSGSKILGHIQFDNTKNVEAAFNYDTGHIHSNDNKLIIGDHSPYIRLWKWTGNSYSEPRVLSLHKSTMNMQMCHPHPRFSPDGKYAVFTTDMSGYCNVYTVEIPQFETLPLLSDLV